MCREVAIGPLLMEGMAPSSFVLFNSVTMPKMQMYPQCSLPFTCTQA
jgi:hypothetical protein